VELPRCVESIDCVHSVWDKYPAGFLSAYKGKEKLAFQVCVSHTKKTSVSKFLLVLQMIKQLLVLIQLFGKFVGRISYGQN